jgi:hypothetical protein
LDGSRVGRLHWLKFIRVTLLRITLEVNLVNPLEVKSSQNLVKSSEFVLWTRREFRFFSVVFFADASSPAKIKRDFYSDVKNAFFFTVKSGQVKKRVLFKTFGSCKYERNETPGRYYLLHSREN